MEGLWDRFDRKVVLYFTGNKDTRVPGMEQELKRVGLYGAERQWQFPSPLDKILIRGMRHIPAIEKVGYFNSSMGHYRAIATSYHLGCNNCLIFEDDVRFMKNIDMINECVKSIPDDYDVALLDCFFQRFEEGCVNSSVMSEWRENRKVNEFWSEFDALYSLGCYSLSRKGMERMMFAFEAVETAKNIGKMRIADHFLTKGILGKDMRMYFARTNVAVQREMHNANSPTDDITNKYIEMGLNLDEYADA